jgi:hypothetical protein
VREKLCSYGSDVRLVEATPLNRTRHLRASAKRCQEATDDEIDSLDSTSKDAVTLFGVERDVNLVSASA